MKKVFILFLLFFITGTSIASAEFFVILNEDNSIHTVAMKNDFVLQDGQRIVMMNGEMTDFCAALPAHPSYCRLVGSEYVYDATLEPKKAFDAQGCEGDLYTEFLPTLSDDDKTILATNNSMLIITRCFSYHNSDSWNTLKAHILSLKQQGLSNDAINSFKQIVKNNHYDIGGE